MKWTPALFFLMSFSLWGEELVIPLVKDPDNPGRYVSAQIKKVEQRKSFQCTLEDTEGFLKRVSSSFSKKALFLDDLPVDSKCSFDLKDVTFTEVYEVVLGPIGYRFKEFEGGLVVIARTCGEEDSMSQKKP